MVIMLAYAINFPHCHVTHLRWRSPVLIRHVLISFLHSFFFFSFITTCKYKNQRKPRNPKERPRNPKEKPRNPKEKPKNPREKQRNRRRQRNRRKKRNPRGQMSLKKPKCRQSLLYGEQYDIKAYAHWHLTCKLHLMFFSQLVVSFICTLLSYTFIGFRFSTGYLINKILRFPSSCNKVAIELRVVLFWSEIIHTCWVLIRFWYYSVQLPL